MHQHHDNCDHDHDHEHRALLVNEEPLDAANQSLADALRASFGILKLIMLVLVVLYLFSNVRGIDGSEQALVVRMGNLQPGVHEAGLVWALPFPLEEIVTLPTRKSNDLRVDSHTFFRREGEMDKPLSFIMRGDGEGLDPSLDGALLTADAGLVHVQWKITYKIDDVRSYVSNFKGKKVEVAEALLKTIVENTGIQVAAELTAEELIRKRVDFVQSEMLRRVNQRLQDLHSGIVVTMVEVFEPTPPLQVRESFDSTQRAENNKQSKIRDAEQSRTKQLSEAAGAAYTRLVALLDEYDQAKLEKKPLAPLQAEIDRMLMDEVEGRAGRVIKDAGAFHSVVVGRMQSDLDLYRTLVPEYERNPHLLIERLWERTREEIANAQGVTKLYRPTGTLMRLQIGLDPDQTRLEEENRVKKQEFDPKKLTKPKMIPLGPEAG